jgi:hypothetical protein
MSERDRYTIVVAEAAGNLFKTWGWEIYRDGEPLPVRKADSRPNTPRHWQARLRSGTSYRVSRKNWLSPIARANLFPCCFERKHSYAVAWFLNALLRPRDGDENGHAPRMVLDGYDPGDRNSCRRPRSFLTAEPRAHTVRAAPTASRPGDWRHVAPTPHQRWVGPNRRHVTAIPTG